MNFKTGLLLVPCLSLGMVMQTAVAQNTRPVDASGTTPYYPPAGDQPVYGKKYYPGEISSETFAEINPLMLLRRGIGLEFETRFKENVTWGLDVNFESSEEKKAALKGSFQHFGIAPKMRWYPMNTLSGIFLGAKMFIGKSTLKVTGSPLIKDVEKSDMQVAPAAHVGYRVVGIGGATLAFYVGGGVNLNKLEVESDVANGATGADFEDVKDKLNKNTSGFRPDYGLTIGIAF